jgi:hypothetical protein
VAETESARSVPNSRHTHEYAVTVPSGAITTSNFATTVYALTATIAGASPDDTADAGTATTVARGDHRHAAPCAAPGSIAPDDAAAEGNSTSFARANHVHGITCGAPAALTLTATAAESSGTGFARDAHVHATSALPWGVVGSRFSTTTAQTLTSVTSGGGTATTDMAVSSVVVDATRLYTVNFAAIVQLVTASSTAGAAIELLVGGTQVDTLWDDEDMQAGVDVWAASRKLWEPASGTVNITTRLRNRSGTTQNFVIGARSTAGQVLARHLWVEDIGPR